MRTDVEKMQLYDLLISDILHNCYDAYTLKEKKTRDSIEYFSNFLFNFDKSPYSLEMIYQANKELKSMNYKRMTKLMEDKVVFVDHKSIVHNDFGEWVVEKGYPPYKYYGEYDEERDKYDCDYELPTNEDEPEDNEKSISNLSSDLKYPDGLFNYNVDSRPETDFNETFKELNKNNMKVKKDRELLRLIKRVRNGNFLCLYNEKNEPVEYIKLNEFEYGCSFYVKLRKMDDNSIKYFKYVDEEKRNKIIEKIVPINEPVLIEILKNVEY